MGLIIFMWEGSGIELYLQVVPDNSTGSIKTDPAALLSPFLFGYKSNRIFNGITLMKKQRKSSKNL
ncbi:MAG: hypothetical protein ACLTL2_09895 [Blautia sp.]